MNFFPAFINVAGREVFLCGPHASEKIPVLRPFGVRMKWFCVDAPQEWEQEVRLEIVRRTLTAEDLDAEPVFVVTAQSEEEDGRIAALCRRRNIPVNAVDRPALCSFIFPSLITRDNLCVAISTGGASPAAAVELKRCVAEQIPEEMDAILEWAAGKRMELYDALPDRSLARELVCRSVRLAMKKGRPLTDEEITVLSAADGR